MSKVLKNSSSKSPLLSETKHALSLIIGQNMRYLRKARNIGLKEIGRIFNISAQQVSKYELGQDVISAPYLFILSQYFKVDLDIFYKFDSDLN